MSFLTPDYLEQLRTGLFADLYAFVPELILSGGIILMLLLRLIKAADSLHLGWVALIVTILALGGAWTQWNPDPPPATATTLFTGLLVFDWFTIYLRVFLLVTAALTIGLSMLTGIPDREDSADFFSLLLGATIGMMLMASANHFLMVYIGVEMASLPSYALAGFLKGRRQSSEASLKYVVYGGAASGVMLYGISLLAGRFGTAYLPEVASGFAVVLQGTTFDPILFFGILLILIGVAFKIAAVPFHFWCPDVFEGAAAEVAAFLSVASKAAALALLGRFGLTMVGAAAGAPEVALESWKPIVGYLGPAIALFAAITATFGNLAAYAQTNLKRLLAYSTIAHAGYMMMAVAPLTKEALEAVLFYLPAYLFMNLGAFAVVAFIRNRTGSEDLAQYGGMIHRAPLLAVALTICFLSLVGIPPFVGFMTKFKIFAVLYDAARTYQNNGLLVLLAIGLINTVISLVYYVKVLRVMIIDSPPAGLLEERATPAGQSAYALIMAAAVTVGIFFWNPLAAASRKGVGHFPVVRAEASPSPQTAVR